MSFCEKGTSRLVNFLEDRFYDWGCFVARHPWKVILMSITITSICSIGFINFTKVADPNKIWIPKGSEYLANKQWLSENFPQNKRVQTLIFKSIAPDENILTPASLKEMFKLHKMIANLRPNNISFEEICERVPVNKLFSSKNCRRKRSFTDVQKLQKKVWPLLLPIHKTDQARRFPGNKGINRQPYFYKNLSEVDNRLPLNRLTKLPTNHSLARHNSTARNISTSFIEPGSDDDGYDTYDYNYDYYAFERDEQPPDDCNDFKQLMESKNGATCLKGKNNTNERKSEVPEMKQVDCDLLDTLESECLEQSLLEIWRGESGIGERTINNLTQNDILFAINNLCVSPYFGFEYDFSKLLGGIKRNSSDHIVAARSAMHYYFTTVDMNNISSLGDADAGTDPDATLDEANYDWQAAVINVVLKETKKMENAGVSVSVRMTRSYTDVTSSAIFFDLKRVAFCGVIMYLYTSMMLGRLDCVEIRFHLTFAGIISILFSLTVCIGVTAALGYPYSPHHSLLPFIMIGIGVDDMFVMVESWYNLDASVRKGQSLEQNIGEAVRHAGVAITVTSLTDVFAFGVGSFTLLPGLEAFCLNCAIGIFALYILQLSWFLAWMVLDQKRIEAKRNAILPCIVQKHKESKAPKDGIKKLSFRNINKNLMKGFTNLLNYNLYCLFILLSTLALLGMGIYGAIQMKHKSDELKHLPIDSYLLKWFDNMKEEFPELGYKVKLFTGAINPEQDLKKLDILMSGLVDLKEKGEVVKEFDSWWLHFKTFVSEKYKTGEIIEIVQNPQNFSKLLSDYLYSAKGGKYKSNFVFNGTLECKIPAPMIAATSSDITYQNFVGSEEHIPAVDTINNLIEKANLSSQTFTIGRVYGSWEIDKVIAFELTRNLALALTCVFLITFILLSNVDAACLVLMCVLFSLIDVIGFLHFWDITIEVLSCSNIVMSVGLCVDYSAHIAHAFLVSSGPRVERAQNALLLMGTAVLNGGTTTFIAVILLCDSTAYAFITFFKVFFLTVLFGLFHAIIFLPVILSFEFGGSTKSNNNKDVNHKEVQRNRSKAKKIGGSTKSNNKKEVTHKEVQRHRSKEKKFVEVRNNEQKAQKANGTITQPFAPHTNGYLEQMKI